jgi:two-component system response regulator AtoC
MSPGSRRVSGELVRAYGSAHTEAEIEIVAHSLHGRGLLHEVEQLAPSFRAVLICGETGTGKTVLAKRLHERACRVRSRPEAARASQLPSRTEEPHASTRSQSDVPGASALPLRVVNCAALSDALLADLLWQLDTEAARADADGSTRTILLDEVGELSPWGQAVLLRKLQNEPLASSARFIAATHRDLDVMAARGTFSRELLFRLCITRLAVAPLRARRDDVVPLALHFLRLALRATETRFIPVDAEMYHSLERYDWPGNVRELKNAIFNALAVNESGTLTVDDLPDAVRAARDCSSRFK